MLSLGAVILAAGESSRLGQPKQLLRFQGQSLVRRIVESAKRSGCEPVIVVVGSEKEKVRAELKDAPVVIVENQDWRSGMGTSIRVGVKALIDREPPVEAILLLVCDQPFVDANVIEQLVALRAKSNKAIVASQYSETLGVPALFDRSCFAELVRLEGDHGAKQIVMRNLERVAVFPFPLGEIDIDTAADHELLAADTAAATEE